MLVLGIDIGGTSIKAAFVDRDGLLFNKKSVKTKRNKDFLPSLFAFIDRMLIERPSKVISGIGIGVPGSIDNDGVIRGAYNIPGLNNISLLSFIKEKYKLPTYIDNDASNATKGEFLFGEGCGYKDIILFTIGTGIGGGIILNKDIWGNNYAGELGHSTVVPCGVLCTCGNYGCLEAYSSASAIIDYVIEASGNMGRKSLLSNYTRSDINGKLIARLAMGGDSLCIAALSRSAYYIGIVISNLIKVLSIRLIVIGGGIAGAGELFIGKIREAVDENMLPILRGSYKIVCARLGEDAGIIGSASYFFYEEGIRKL